MRSISKDNKIKTAVGDDRAGLDSKTENFFYVWILDAEDRIEWHAPLFDLESVNALINEMERAGIPTDEAKEHRRQFSLPPTDS